MKMLLKFAIGSIGFVLLISLFSGVSLRVVDLTAFKSQIQSLVKTATGRELIIEGGLQVNLALVPTITAREVRFANADWASEPDMLTAKQVWFKVSILPLLVGQVDIEQIGISDARLLLEQNAAGIGNWTLAVTEGAKGNVGTEVSNFVAWLPDVKGHGVSITYRDASGKTPVTFALDHIFVRPAVEAAFVDARGQIDGRAAVFSGRIAGDETAFMVDPFTLTFEEQSFRGAVAIKQTKSQPLPYLESKIVAQRLDLTPLMIGGDTSGDSSTDGNFRLFNTAPFSFDILESIDGTMDISVDSLMFQKFELDDVRASLVLKRGKLTMPITFRYGETRVEARTEISAGQTPEISLDLKAPGLNIGSFLKQAQITDLVELTGYAGAELSARGNSSKALASGLTGNISLIGGSGEIHSGVFDLVSGRLMSFLFPKGVGSDVAKVVCFAHRIDFNAGVGTFSTLVLATEHTETTGSGHLNLRDETIDLTLKPKPTDITLFSLATPIRVKGALNNVDVHPETGALVEDVAIAVGAGLLTGGFGALLPFASLGDSKAEDVERCFNQTGTLTQEEKEKNDGLAEDTVKSSGHAVKDTDKNTNKNIGGSRVFPVK